MVEIEKVNAVRESITSRIRAALADVSAGEAPAGVPVARDYRQASSTSKAELIEQFRDRLVDYKAVVHLVSPQSIHEAIAESLRARGVRRLVVPADFPFELPATDVTLLRDPGLSLPDLESSDGVLTTCAVAISETGTIVLDCGPGQGRRSLSLVPDYHLCIVRSDQIVELVPEAVARLSESASGPGRPMTWISGPSATSDIELNRVEGVHGPRTLDVLIVE
jgi:L-lactate dehydrogenase complex protein LldG